jgi:mannose-6-phosphate isomerase-like protein (cupin superfamily)
MHQPLSRSVAVGPRDGETITDRPNRAVRLIVAGDDAISMTWSRYGQGEHGPDLHVHHDHTDAFYVLAGELTYTFGAAGEREVTVGAGTVVVAPPDVPHAFRNDGADDAVFLNVHTPDSGFATSMRRLRDRVDGAAFDQHVPPATGNRPAADALVIPAGTGDPGPDPTTLVRYVGEDLVLTEEPDRITISIPSSPGPDVTYLIGA